MRDLLPLTEILEHAQRAGFGDAARLRRTFNQFHGYGLIANYVQKRPRKGGEGLWHPIQLDLFLCYLRSIKESGTKPGGSYRGDILHRAASIPIGLWLYGEEGVPLTQVKRCLDFQWKGYLKAVLKSWDARPIQFALSHQSDEARSIQDYVREIALIRTANRRRAPRVIRELYHVLRFGSLESLSRAIWNDGIGQLLDGEPREDALHLADQWRFQIDCFLCGLQYMEILVRDSAPVDGFWQWMREAYRYANSRWRATVEAMKRGSPELVEGFVKPVFGTPTLEGDLLDAGRDVLMSFGFGIKQLRGEIHLREDSKSPRPNPALAAIFEP